VNEVECVLAPRTLEADKKRPYRKTTDLAVNRHPDARNFNH